jgi:hypothetical protein
VAPPAGIGADWVIANGPRPVRGPASALAWEGEERHGCFYAAWPTADDDSSYWEDSGAREVLVISNHELARQAGLCLAVFGVLPGEAGLTATEVARRLRTPWKGGVLDDEQVTRTASPRSWNGGGTTSTPRTTAPTGRSGAS